MFHYYVYIIKCSDNSYYTGITSDLDNRFKEHVYGKYRTCYTFKRRPLELKFQETYFDVLSAIYFEKKIKGWTRAKKKALIESDSESFQLLSECRNASHYKYFEDKGNCFN